MFLSFVYSTAVNTNGITVVLRGSLDVLAGVGPASFSLLLYLGPSFLRMEHVRVHLLTQGYHPCSKPINTDRTEVNRPETDKDDQTLFLSHYHTNM